MPLDAAPPPPEPSSSPADESKKKRKFSSAQNLEHNLLASVEQSLASVRGKQDKRIRSSSPSSGGGVSAVKETSVSSSSRQTTGGSREKALEAEALFKSYQEKLQGFCFICRVEENKSCGQVILCDFPDCYRAFHTVSVLLSSFC
jgi:hypothetical protein